MGCDVNQMHVDALTAQLASTEKKLAVFQAKVERLKRKRGRLHNAMILALIRRMNANREAA